MPLPAPAATIDPVADADTPLPVEPLLTIGNWVVPEASHGVGAVGMCFKVLAWKPELRDGVLAAIDGESGEASNGLEVASPSMIDSRSIDDDSIGETVLLSDERFQVSVGRMVVVTC